MVTQSYLQSILLQAIPEKHYLDKRLDATWDTTNGYYLSKDVYELTVPVTVKQTLSKLITHFNNQLKTDFSVEQLTYKFNSDDLVVTFVRKNRYDPIVLLKEVESWTNTYNKEHPNQTSYSDVLLTQASFTVRLSEEQIIGYRTRGTSMESTSTSNKISRTQLVKRDKFDWYPSGISEKQLIDGGFQFVEPYLQTEGFFISNNVKYTLNEATITVDSFIDDEETVQWCMEEKWKVSISS